MIDRFWWIAIVVVITAAVLLEYSTTEIDVVLDDEVIVASLCLIVTMMMLLSSSHVHVVFFYRWLCVWETGVFAFVGWKQHENESLNDWPGLTWHIEKWRAAKHSLRSMPFWCMRRRQSLTWVFVEKRWELSWNILSFCFDPHWGGEWGPF